MANLSEVVSVDGSCDWSGGVDSVKVPTIANSTDNPNGLAINQLAWLMNAGLRDGGITPRSGWKRLCKMADSSKLWQGGFMYQPDTGDPYLVFQVSGNIYSLNPDAAGPALLTSITQPATEEKAYFCQGEQFLVMQAGDNSTLPLFYDGNTVRRSNGISVNLGTTSAGFTAPAIGKAVNIPITTPPGFAGTYGEVFEVNGDTSAIYIYVNPAWNIGLKNISANATGTVKAGTPLYHYNGNLAGYFLSSFTIPALNATDTTWLNIPYVGAVNDFVTIGGQLFQVVSIGTGGPPANNIIGLNTNQTAGTVNAASVSLTSIQEIGAASPMDYYEGRLWYAIGRQFLAGDIVRGPSGTAFYNFRDSILKVTENPLCLAGDGFTVADNAGNIKAIFHNANINTTLGQGNLYIATEKVIYSLDVPTTRADWIAANSSNEPKQTVVQVNNAVVSDRSVTLVNGDAWFQTLEPSISSLMQNVRNFTQWGTISLSANENRLLQFNDRALLKFASGVYFNNRMYQTALPRRVAQGVVHDAIVPLDFVPLSSFGASLTPNWEGHIQAMPTFQMFYGSFGGRERAFAVVLAGSGDIELWEITQNDKFDNVPDAAATAAAILSGANEHRIDCYAEFPAFTWGDINTLKKLTGGELGVDRVFGTIDFTLQFRPDSDSCWHNWHEWQICSAKNTCEEGVNTYPCVPLGEGYKQNKSFPLPQEKCASQSSRPVNLAYQFQVRLAWKGFCRIRNLKLYAQVVQKPQYQDLAC